jgi:hypothetical protein
MGSEPIGILPHRKRGKKEEQNSSSFALLVLYLMMLSVAHTIQH